VTACTVIITDKAIAAGINTSTYRDDALPSTANSSAFSAANIPPNSTIY
jgi:hypothetical protein